MGKANEATCSSVILISVRDRNKLRSIQINSILDRAYRREIKNLNKISESDNEFIEFNTYERIYFSKNSLTIRPNAHNKTQKEFIFKTYIFPNFNKILKEIK